MKCHVCENELAIHVHSDSAVSQEELDLVREQLNKKDDLRFISAQNWDIDVWCPSCQGGESMRMAIARINALCDDLERKY